MESKNITLSSSLFLKTLVNDLENTFDEFTQKFSIQRDTFQSFLTNFEKSYETIITDIQEKFNQIVLKLNDSVSLEYDLYQKEKLLKQTQNAIELEKGLFQTELKNYEEKYQLPSEIIELNVGGQYFSTLRSTLTDVVPDSMLSSMFSGRWPLTKDINGYCYIDRDPQLFALVLNGLRNNGHWIEPSDSRKRTDLIIELDYFCLKMKTDNYFLEQFQEKEINRIYIMGGFKGRKTSKDVEFLDLFTEKWCQSCELKFERDWCTAVSNNCGIFLIGGSGTESVEFYSPYNNQFISLKSLFVPRWASAAVLLDNHIYVIGGDYSFMSLNTVECYNIKTDDWTIKSTLQTPRSQLACVTLLDFIFAIGGTQDMNYPLDSVEKYDTINDVWEYISPLKISRKGLAAVTIRDYIYVMGGYDMINVINSVECYDLNKDTWSPIHPMIFPRCGFAAVSGNNKIFVIGGYIDFGKKILTTSVEVYNTESEKWKVTTSMNKKKGQFAAVSFFYEPENKYEFKST